MTITDADRELASWINHRASDASLEAIATFRERAALEATQHLRRVLREIYEEWAGSDGFIPETAPEGYLLALTKRMARMAIEALDTQP